MKSKENELNNIEKLAIEFIDKNELPSNFPPYKVVNLLSSGFSQYQTEYIVDSAKEDIDLIPFVNPNNNLKYMETIKGFLKEGFDPMPYLEIAKQEKLPFTPEQLKEIQLGLEGEMDVSIYAHPYYSTKQMAEIRMYIENCLDPTPLLRPEDRKSNNEISITNNRPSVQEKMRTLSKSKQETSKSKHKSIKIKI